MGKKVPGIPSAGPASDEMWRAVQEARAWHKRGETFSLKQIVRFKRKRDKSRVRSGEIK